MHTIQSQLSRLFSTTHITSRPPPFIFRRFQFAASMTGRSNSKHHRNPQHRPETVGHGGSSKARPGFNGGHSNAETDKWVPKKADHKDVLDAYDHDFPSLPSSCGPIVPKRKKKVELSSNSEPRMEKSPMTPSSSKLEASPVGNQTIKDDEALLVESSLPTSFGKERWDSPTKRHKIRQTSSESSSSPEPFDICYPEKEGIDGQILRPGMVLLKNYISLYEQIEIVKKCRDLGVSRGGFYQPGYEDGAKLRLQMMCLGQDWDPQTRAYGGKRAFDGAEPPGIPTEFELLVKRAIKDSRALIEKNEPTDNVEDILPSISPDVCIVNFYTTGGRLGLHQDRDESKESLRKGLPVVSFSIGDSAEFLYGDGRDIDKAEKVVLDSGDVLIFGGESRHIFHGVSHIIGKSAPRALWAVTRLKHGRLNLTFRQY